ncbi:hypothetical protein QAD02_008073 [Eretmocerus hayati]|uniref:Uncharacterized protein n=1 Tax=Eretmocerus hayati TaxID=131215 RepID=A0ACC2N5Q3_9HYME|nr:hypothetical protein QAD02_008073 [Eretmocerus hayati]
MWRTSRTIIYISDARDKWSYLLTHGRDRQISRHLFHAQSEIRSDHTATMLPGDSANIENAVVSVEYPNDLENLELRNIEVFGFEDEKNDIERDLATVGKLRGAAFVQTLPDANGYAL